MDLAAGIALGRILPPPAASRPTVSSKPATRPFGSPELVVACGARVVALRAQLDETFAVIARPPFVVAGNMSAELLETLTDGSVVRPAKAMWSSYFQIRPDKVVTVLLFADGRSYRLWAAKLYGDRDVPYFGYYRGDKRTLVMNIATGTGTLVHELTHALIGYDFPDVPTWFNEGLASLHEQCNVGEKEIVGLPNWRLRGLRESIKATRLRPLRDLVTKRDFSGPLQGINYAQARYFVMYMQQRRLLRKFYAHFRRHHAGPNADVKAIEHVFSRDIDNIEKGFLAWVMTLKFNPR